MDFFFERERLIWTFLRGCNFILYLFKVSIKFVYLCDPYRKSKAKKQKLSHLFVIVFTFSRTDYQT